MVNTNMKTRANLVQRVKNYIKIKANKFANWLLPFIPSKPRFIDRLFSSLKTQVLQQYGNNNDEEVLHLKQSRTESFELKKTATAVKNVVQQ